MNVQSWVFTSVTHTCHSKTILPPKLSYQFKAPSPRRMAQSSVSQKIWTVNVQNQGFTSAIKEWPIQDHLLSKYPVLTQQALSPKRLEWMCWGFPLSVMNTLYKIIFQVILFSILNHASTHSTTHIWLPHCKSQPHSHYVKWAYRSTIFAYIYQNTTNNNSYFTLQPHMCQKQTYPSNATYMLHIPITSCAHETTMSLCMLLGGWVDYLFWLQSMWIKAQLQYYWQGSKFLKAVAVRFQARI